MTFPHLIPLLGQLIFIAFLPLTLLLLILSSCYKFFVVQLATLLQNELIEPLSPSSMFYVSDDFTTNPCFVVPAIFTLKGVPSRQRVYQDFEKLIELRSAKDNTLIYWKFQAHIVRWMGYFWWKQDTSFSLRNHIHFIEGDVSSFQNTSKFVDGLIRKSFRVNGPLWDVTFISNKDQETSVMVLRVGHIIMDGFSFLKAYHRLGGQRNLPDDIPQVVSKANPFFQKVGILAIGMFFGTYDYLKKVEASQDSNSICAFTEPEIKTGEWACGFVPGINLAKFKRARKILKCSFFDLLLTGFSGGLRKFMETKGTFPENINYVAALPKPNHPDDVVLNHFFFTIMRLPLSIGNLRERIKAIRKASMGGRPTPVSAFLEFVSEALSILPIANFSVERINLSGFSGCASFMPGGERFPGFFGLESEVIQFCLPVGNVATMTCAGLTGNGNIWLSLTVDRGAINDPADIVTLTECIHVEFEDIFRSAQQISEES